MAKNNYVKSATRKAPRALAGKTVVKLFNQDGVRELLIPSGEPNYYPIVLTQDRLSTLEKQATKKSTYDLVKERERLAEESKQRKAKFRELDDNARKKSAKLTQLEQEAKEKANYLLQRAWELRLEQEDEVKAANSLILKTKCQAIRDAQLAEQALIKSKLQEDERKREKAMEEERIKKIIEEKRNLELERTKKDKYVKELTKQVEEIHSQQLMEFEKKIQERQRLNEAMHMMMMDEVRIQREAELAKTRTRKELAIANEQIRKAHMMEKEEARLADLKVQEWMRLRAEREQALEREQAEARKRKELETARLRAMQEKAGELQAQQEHMMAVRRQEEYEREWRKKEKEAAIKKKKTDEKCLEVRNKQVTEIRQIKAMEIAREKGEYERIMQLQSEAEQKERQQEDQRKRAREMYREALLKQMNEKEAKLMLERREELDEGVAMTAEIARREGEVRRILRTKVDHMRVHKVPDMYVTDIIRQLHLNNED